MAPAGYRNAAPGVDRDRELPRVAVLAGGGFVLVAVITVVVLVVAPGSTVTKGGAGKASAHTVLAASSDAGGGADGGASNWSGGAAVTPTNSGSDPNGSDPNGSDPNGSDPNGSDPNGSDPNGSDPNGGGSNGGGSNSGDSNGAGVVSVVPSDSGSGDTQPNFVPSSGSVSVTPTDPDDSDGTDSNGTNPNNTGSSAVVAPSVPSVQSVPSDSGSGGGSGSNPGQVATPTPSNPGQATVPAPSMSVPAVVSAPTVCNRIVPDFDALHTALLTATVTDVFCIRSSDNKPTAISAVSFARAALGTPYVWGGNGRSDGGYDCSGLISAAYASAGLRLPRTAQLQYNAIPKLPDGAQIQPGDLVFFGSGPKSVTHVGIAISPTMMINAPQTGEVVKIAPLHRKDLVGIARPSNMKSRRAGTD
jgi:cell wall-associated NlpC family hydrolase